MKQKISELNKKEIHIINIVWGKKYIDFFLNINLPNNMSDKNLQFLSEQKNFKIIYKIYAIQEEKQIIEDSSVYKKIKKYIEAEIIIFELKEEFKYSIVNNCYNDALKNAFKKDAILFLLCADIICSDNFFNSIFSYIKEGYRCVALIGIRLAKESFLKFLENSKIGLEFSSRKLVEIALKNLHTASKSLFINSKTIPSHYRSQMYFKIDENNLLAKAFHFHPIMIWPEKKINLDSPIDATLIQNTISSEKKIKVIEDSDDLVLFELTDDDFTDVYGNLIKRKFYHIGVWATRYTQKFNKFFIRHKMIYRSCEIEPKLSAIEKRTDNYLRMIYIIYVFFNIIKLFKKILVRLFRSIKYFKNILKKLFSLFKKTIIWKIIRFFYNFLFFKNMRQKSIKKQTKI